MSKDVHDNFVIFHTLTGMDMQERNTAGPDAQLTDIKSGHTVIIIYGEDHSVRSSGTRQEAMSLTQQSQASLYLTDMKAPARLKEVSAGNCFYPSAHQ